MRMAASVERASLLLNAAARGHHRQVKFFIDAGYDLDAMDQEGNTALKLAVTHVKDNNVRNPLIALLLKGGADPNYGDRNGLTPLMHSILLRQMDSVRILMDSKKIDFSAEDLMGNTILMHAAALGLAEIVSMILERLSAIHRVIYVGHRNCSGLTAVDVAEQSGHKILASTLMNRKSPYTFPGRTSSSLFADPRQLDSDQEPVFFNLKENISRRSSDSSYYSRSSGSIVLSSDESIRDSPVVALLPGPLRKYRVQASVIGIEPIVETNSPAGRASTSIL